MKFWKILILAIIGGVVFLQSPNTTNLKSSEEVPVQNNSKEDFAAAHKYESVAILTRINSNLTSNEENFFPNLSSKFLFFTVKVPINKTPINQFYIGYSHILTHFITRIIIFPFHFYW